MQINAPGLASVYYNLRLGYDEAFQRAPTFWEKIATKQPSLTRENRYAWMNALTKMREWVGERIIQNVSSSTIALINRPFEKTIGIKRDDIEDDQLGLYAGAVAALGEQGKLWPDDLILAALLAGTTALAYDGQPFFDASHPVLVGGSTTFSNNFTSTPLNAANYGVVRAAMRSYVGVDGRSMFVNPNTLVVAPQKESLAKSIVESEMLITVYGSNTAAAAADNTYKGTASVLTLPGLSGFPDTWYLMDTSKAIKPLIFQERKAAQLVSMTDMTSENVFWRAEYVYGIDARGTAGYSLPFLAARATA